MGLHKNAAHRAREGVTAKNRRKEARKAGRSSAPGRPAPAPTRKPPRPAPPPSLRDDPPLPLPPRPGSLEELHADLSRGVQVPAGTQTTIAPVTPADVAPKADRAAGMVQFRILVSELEELRAATRCRPEDGPRDVIKAAITVVRILTRH